LGGNMHGTMAPRLTSTLKTRLGSIPVSKVRVPRLLLRLARDRAWLEADRRLLKKEDDAAPQDEEEWAAPG
jgi:hypothetical protein